VKNRVTKLNHVWNIVTILVLIFINISLVNSIFASLFFPNLNDGISKLTQHYKPESIQFFYVKFSKYPDPLNYLYLQEKQAGFDKIKKIILEKDIRIPIKEPNVILNFQTEDLGDPESLYTTERIIYFATLHDNTYHFQERHIYTEEDYSKIFKKVVPVAKESDLLRWIKIYKNQVIGGYQIVIFILLLSLMFLKNKKYSKIQANKKGENIMQKVNEARAKLSDSMDKLKQEWGIFLWAAFRPQVLVPFIFAILALYVANQPNINKSISLLLQIIATITGGITICFFYDVIRSAFENSLLVKKGLSAVRNLSLARLKTINISGRQKKKALPEETINLLSLLEKDIANAIQEWNDILPGVGKIEIAYHLLSEKEQALEQAKEEKEALNQQLKNLKETDEKDKGSLQEKLDQKEKRIEELEEQVSDIKVNTDVLPLTGASLGTSNVYIGTLSQLAKICKKCGMTYYSAAGNIDDGRCAVCKF